MNFKNTQRKIEEMIEKGDIPGASYSFINGVNVEEHVVGNQQVKPKPQVLKPNQQYDVASLTKVVGTLMVVLQLVQNGQLKLDASVSEFFPQFKHPEVKIINLLTHTSGIEGYIKNRDQLNNNELHEALLNLDVDDDQLNQEMHYSDVNFIFLGWIASLIMGMPIQSLIETMVLRPLGLNNSTFHPDPERSVPTTYDETTKTTKTNRKGKVHDPKAQVLGNDCGSAGLFSTLDDLSHFCQFLLQIDRTQSLLRPDTIDDLFKDHTPMQDGTRSYGWALGNHHGHSYLWQAGYTGVFLILVREARNGFVFLSNRIHPSVNEEFIKDRDDLIGIYLDELFG